MKIKKKTHKFLNVVVMILLWVAAPFFIIGGLATLGGSILSAVLTVLIGVTLLPPLWRWLRWWKPQLASLKLRIPLMVLLLCGAVLTSPGESTPTQTSQPKERVVVTQSAPKKVESVKSQERTKTHRAELVDKVQKISSIGFKDSRYTLTGTGLADKRYILKFSNGDALNTSTNKTGDFVVNLPPSTQAFGYVELTRDVNGFWFGGHETYNRTYFALDKQNTVKSDTSIKPILYGLGASSTKYDISGLYSPHATLLLKNDNATMSMAKVGRDGRYTFKNVALNASYTKVTISEKISTGWFSSKQHILAARYLDKGASRILNELPVMKKQEAKSEVIAFSSLTEESSSLNKGESKITQDGSNGERTITYEVTYRGDQEIGRATMSDVVSKQPVNQRTIVGTHVAPVYVAPQRSAAPQTPSGGRTGAICNDGSPSSATGRGACSHHGGVAQWLYQ